MEHGFDSRSRYNPVGGKQFVFLRFCFTTTLHYPFNHTAKILGTWYSHKPLNEKDLLGNDIHTTANAFSLVKKRYKFWMHYITPVSITLWLPLYCRDYVRSLDLPQEAAKYTIMALLISACIGALIGYLWHRKVVNTCDEAVKQLEED